MKTAMSGCLTAEQVERMVIARVELGAGTYDEYPPAIQMGAVRLALLAYSVEAAA